MDSRPFGYRSGRALRGNDNGKKTATIKVAAKRRRACMNTSNSNLIRY